ncbi:MAG: hypothetical protein P9X24_15445 [Candidatus Hatepunaea meridiana]|nr:hypothetical protein [Candidatus Hatepunaea meridiana]
MIFGACSPFNSETEDQDPTLIIVKRDNDPNERQYGIGNSHPAWSPDGNCILYEHEAQNVNERNNGFYQIILHDLKTHRDTFIVSGRLPTWSPDGDRFAFVRGNVLMQYDLKTDSIKTLITLKANIFFPDWGPSNLIVFDTFHENPFRSLALWTFDPMEGELRSVGDMDKGSFRKGDWHPDGERIFHTRWVPVDTVWDYQYERDLVVDGEELFVMDLNNEYIERLTDDKESQSEPVVSPDGKWLAYTYREGLWNIKVMNLETREEKFVTKKGGRYPHWAPDSEHIVYISVKPEGNLCIVSIVKTETFSIDRWSK